MPAKFFIYTRTGKLITIVACFCLLFNILIWLQLTSQLKSDKRQAIATAIQRNSNLAASLEQYAESTISKADAVVQLVKKEYEEKGNAISFAALFRRGIIGTNCFNGVFIMDSGGTLLKSNLAGLRNAAYAFSDRDYFTFHKRYPDSLHISHPLISRTIGKTVIVISRRLNTADGRFAGIVALQIEPATFTEFYANANLGQRDIISLISPVGITYTRRTGNRQSAGEDISKSPLFRYVTKIPVGNYFAPDAIKGIPTYFSYRKLDRFPVIATVGSAEQDILADYNEKSTRDFTFGAIISSLLVLFSFLISHFFIDRQKSIQTIRNKEAHYRSIFENSRDSILLVDKQCRIEAINKAGVTLFNVEENQLPVLLTQLFYSSASFSSFEKFMEVYPSESEVELVRFDGSRFTGEVAHSHFKDSDGSCKMMLLVRDITLRKQMEKRLLTEQKRYQRRLTKQIILAQEREREVIGHELHDNVNQILTTVKLFLEMAHQNPDLRGELLPKSIFHIQKCIHEIRNLSHELSAPTLGTQSLVDSIKALVDTVQASGSFAISLQVEQYHTTLEKDQRLAIYRILQEQLNNIIKHAKATSVKILLSQTISTTQVVVQDNGQGFDTTQKQGGIGFSNMLSRVKVFGGEMWVKSAPGEGCTVHIDIPIKAEEKVAVEMSVS